MTNAGINMFVEPLCELCRGRAPVSVMEVCGTHTVSIMRSGIRSLLPENVHLLSGPGCPVCVTCQGYIDAAIALARQKDIAVCTYGDMVRVPGTESSLAAERSRGGDIRVVYSAHDAVEYAANEPQKQVVFLAVGFETTAPATAAAVLDAQNRGLDNFFILNGHKRVIPALDALLTGGAAKIDAFLCPGHVSIIIGSRAYEPIARRYHKPCVIAGFEPEPILRAITEAVRRCYDGDGAVCSTYPVVRKNGNPVALELIERVFEPCEAVWRSIGRIGQSGMALREAYASVDAAQRFGLDTETDPMIPGCMCGEVIQGLARPVECALFGTLCTPLSPHGPCMVSSEGSCAAWYKYGDAA